MGRIPTVSTRLTWKDRLGTWKARWRIGRMRYQVEPGLYAVGSPTNHSEVLVTANYKMSFDSLRTSLSGIDAWILVLDTRAINVWCAAGKGTFGTAELVRRIGLVRLHDRVSHGRLILPQLGAPGVAAHEVKEQSGFRVVYGPVRAADIPAFLAARRQATPEMRRVRFPLRDRVALIPTDIPVALKFALPVMFLVLLASGLAGGVLSGPARWGEAALNAITVIGVAVLAVALPPLLLPWLPGRAFAAKGAWVGLGIAVVGIALTLSRPGVTSPWISAAGWLFLAPAVTSFMAMNFTGSSTFTSLSGVLREMRVAVPLQIAAGALGVALFVAGYFV